MKDKSDASTSIIQTLYFCLEHTVLAHPFSFAKKPVRTPWLPCDLDCATVAVSKW
jgi:hypothetical protein